MQKNTVKQKSYAIAKGKTYFEAKQYAKKGAGSWFAKLGQSLVAVVVVLPFAGLFAAVGGIVMSLVKNNEAAYTFGLILSDLGQTVLSNLGLLFMLAILLGFTNAKGYAIFSSIVGYIAFVGFITPFIRYNGDPGATTTTTFDIWFWHDLSIKTQLANIFGLGQDALSMSKAAVDVHGAFARASYRGFTTLNTGVLGGIVLGFIDVWIYNKGKDLHLPNMLAFFSGEKFTSVVALCVSPIIASLFIIIWPGVNYVLGEIGVGLTYLPYGIDAGVFGIAKQLLIPFEAHQALIAPLWYTAAGGQLGQKEANVIMAMMYRISDHSTAGIGQEANYMDQVNAWINGLGDGNLVDKITSAISGKNPVTLDKLWGFLDLDNVQGLKPYASQIKEALNNYSELNWQVSGDQLMTMEVLNNHPNVDIRDFWDANLKITRFITGGYANLMFLTPAVGLAIWSTLPKGPRRRKFAFYFGALMPSFLLGVNEPIIFMFAYTAPIIYYVWYSGICGVLFLFTALFQAKLSSTFSQGLLDYVVNGIIPTVTRPEQGAQQTMLWVPLIIGIIAFVFGFLIFRWLFIRNEFMAPGMEEQVVNGKVGKSVYSTTKPLVIGLLDYFSGYKNIKSIEWHGSVLVVTTNKSFEYKKNDFSDQIFENVIINKDGTVTLVMQRDDDAIKRAVKYIQALVQYNTTRQPNKLTDQDLLSQKLAKIEAKWQIRHDSLDQTNDIEKETAEFKENLWALTDQEQRELLAAQNKHVEPISEETKQKAKELTKQHKQRVKELEEEKKAKVKAERHSKKQLVEQK